MKKSVIKTIATLTLALSLVMTGAVAAEGVAPVEGEYGVSMCSDYPFDNIVPVN